MASKQSSASDQTPSSSKNSSSEPRRNFGYQIASIVIGGVVGVTPLLVGLVNFLDPLFGRRKTPLAYAQDGAGDDDYIRISSLEALEEGGPPQRFPVIADKRDAWNYMPDQPIGAVYVQRTAPNEVLVFNTTCPHAGCSVSCTGTAFHCPCHNSAFNLDGTKLESKSGRKNPSPRALDELDVDPVRLVGENPEVWVKFQNFYTGKEHKKPKS
jgi:Rieske Fe-S protein